MNKIRNSQEEINKESFPIGYKVMNCFNKVNSCKIVGEKDNLKKKSSQ